jgi:membrane protein implicated in regulation of membrane protease activity
MRLKMFVLNLLALLFAVVFLLVPMDEHVTWSVAFFVLAALSLLSHIGSRKRFERAVERIKRYNSQW